MRATKWSPHLYILELLLGMLLSIFFDPSKLPLAVKALIIGATSFFIPYICYNDPHHCLSVWPLSHLYEALSIRDTPAMALVLGFVLAAGLVLYIALCYVFTKFITLKYERSTTEYKIMTIGAAIGVLLFVLFIFVTSVMHNPALAPPVLPSGSGGVEASKPDSDAYVYDPEYGELKFDPFDDDLDGRLSEEERSMKYKIIQRMRELKDKEKLKEKTKEKDKKKEKEKEKPTSAPYQPPPPPHQQGQGQVQGPAAAASSLGWLRALKKSYIDFAVNNPVIYYVCWIGILTTCVGCAYLIWKENMLPAHTSLPLHGVPAAVPPMTLPPGPGLAEQPPAFGFPTYIEPARASASTANSEDSADDEDSEHEPVGDAEAKSTGQARLSRQTSASSLAVPARSGRPSTLLTPPVLITRATSPVLSRRGSLRNSKSDRDGDEDGAEVQDFDDRNGGRPAGRLIHDEGRTNKRMSLPIMSMPTGARRVSPLTSPRAKTSADLTHDYGLNANGDGGDLYRNPQLSRGNSTAATQTTTSRRLSTPKRQTTRTKKGKTKTTPAKKLNVESASDEGLTSATASGSEREGNGSHEDREEDNGAGVCRGGYGRRPSVGSGTERNNNGGARGGQSGRREDDEQYEEAQVEEEKEVEDDDELREDVIKDAIKESISEELGDKFWRERERTLAELETLRHRYDRERFKYKNLKQTFAKRMQEADEQADKAKRVEAQARAELEQRLKREKASDLDALQRSVNESAQKSEETLRKQSESEHARAERIKRKLTDERQRNEELNRRVEDERTKLDELTRRMEDERTRNEERLNEERTRHDNEKRISEEAMRELEMRMKRVSDSTGDETMALELYKKIDEERAKADEWRRRLDAECEKVERLKSENEAEKQKNHELSLQIDEMSAKMTEILMNVTHLNLRDADSEAERLKQEKRKSKQETNAAPNDVPAKKEKEPAEKIKEKKEKVEKNGLPLPNIVVSASLADAGTAPAIDAGTPKVSSLFSPTRSKSEKRRSITLTPTAIRVAGIANPSPSPSPDTAPEAADTTKSDLPVDESAKPAESVDATAGLTVLSDDPTPKIKEAPTVADVTPAATNGGSDSDSSSPASTPAESSPLLSPVKAKSEKRRSVTLTPTAVRLAAAAATVARPTTSTPSPVAKLEAATAQENGTISLEADLSTTALATSNGNGNLLSTPVKSNDALKERRRSATPTPKAKSS